MKHILTIVGILLVFFCKGQMTKKEAKAEEIGLRAIQIIDDGDYVKAIDLLLKAQKLDPKRFDYPYEIGYALYASKLYNETIQQLKPLLSHSKATDVVYQLLGNAYDEVGKSDSAIWSYEFGMTKFPNSGKLYSESGLVEYRRKDYDKAVEYWENGIRAEPNFPSNYYWLGRVLSDSNMKIWSLMYGETFMLLEPNTTRTQEISEILYNTYNSSIDFETDSTSKVSLNNKIDLDAEEFLKDNKPPFELSFEVLFTLACSPDSSRTKQDLNIFTFSKIRTDFLRYWMEKDFEMNTLFSFHNNLVKNNVYDAYNFWLLMMGDVDNYKKWFDEKGDEFERFVAYFNDNRPHFNDENLIIRE